MSNNLIDAKPATREWTEDLEDELAVLELNVLINYTLADAIREGAQALKQCQGWGDGVKEGCALTAAIYAARRRGYRV
jgi:hypothetical protein